jgi:hypothetical protein
MKAILLAGIASLGMIFTANAQTYVTKTKETGTLYTTPSVPQAGYFAGANPCLVGAGAGGSGGPIGLSIAFGRNDEACQRRSDAAAWHALGMDDVAVARMLQDEDNLKAYQNTGRPMPGTTPISAPNPNPGTMPPSDTSPIAPRTTALPGPISLNNPLATTQVVAVQTTHHNIPAWCENQESIKKVTKVYYEYMCGGVD